MKLTTPLCRIAGTAAIALISPTQVQALTITWNNSGTDFNTSGSWTGGLPGTADAAAFSSAKVNNPNLSSNISVGQLVFNTSGSGYDLTSSGGALTLTSIGTGTLTTGAGPAIYAVGALTNTISAPVILGAAAGSTMTFRGSAATTDTTISGAISEANAGINITVTDNGKWTFSGANSYTGTTALAASAVLTVAHNSGLGSTAGGTIVASGTSLQLKNYVTITGEALQLTGSGISNGGALRNASGDNTYAGAITTSGAARINSDSGTLLLDVTSGNAITGVNDNLTFGGAGNVTVADAIATGTGSLTKDGAGTLRLSAANTFTGKTTITGGTLSINSIANVSGGASSLGAPITVANGTIDIGGGGTLAYTGSGHTTNRWVNLSAGTTGGSIDASGTGALVFTGNITSGNSSKTLTLTGTSTHANEISGVISNNSVTEITSLTKSGSGKWVLSSASGNSYSGTTNVSNGTLVANCSTGSSTGTGAVVVGTDGILGGSGRVAPTVANGITVSGTLAPGDGFGTLTVDLSGTSGTVTMLSGSGFQYQLGSAGSMATPGTSDLLTIVGAAANDFSFSSNNIDFLNTGAMGFYKLFDTSSDNPNTWTGLTVSGTGLITGGLTVSNLANGYTGNLIMGGNSFGGTSGDIYLQVIPEPGAALLGSLGALALLRRRRTS